MSVSRRRAAVLVPALLALCSAAAVFSAVFSAARAYAPSGPVPANRAEVVAAIRRGLRDHASYIEVTFEAGPLDDPASLAAAWVEEAMAETGDPREGDYIRCQNGGYTLRCERGDADASRFRYTVTVVPDYYLSLAQEEAVTAKLDELAFDFPEGTGDYQKIAFLYGYLCENVRYDAVHRKNPHYHLRSTAYAALVQGAATCQGYAVALYRLLREAGIDCRVVTGMAASERGKEFHAWNIAALDGAYYLLDATWDAGRDEPRFFLLGAADSADHVPGGAFQTDAFTRRYPLARERYAVAEGGA